MSNPMIDGLVSALRVDVDRLVAVVDEFETQAQRPSAQGNATMSALVRQHAGKASDLADLLEVTAKRLDDYLDAAEA